MDRRAGLMALGCALGFASGCGDAAQPAPPVAEMTAGHAGTSNASPASTAGKGGEAPAAPSANAGSAGSAPEAGGSSGGSSASGGSAPSAGVSAMAGTAAGGNVGTDPPQVNGPFKILVFSKTTDYRHDSIAAGIQTIDALGKANDFEVVASEDESRFTDALLADYRAVVFLQADGSGLTADGKAAFERFIHAGGGFVGVHCASCSMKAWPWYDQLLGAVFSDHPQIQTATIKVEGHTHASTLGLPDSWQREEEWYNFETNPRAAVTVLLTLDESTYSGGTMGGDHPISWSHTFEGGRAWYTALGHSIQGYQDPWLRQHLLGGIEYAAGRKP